MTTLPRHSPAGSAAHHGTVIDWSDVRMDDGTGRTVQDLVNWVSNCPRSSGIRVYLPSVAHRAGMQKLQRALLSMGCTVTCRFSA